MRTIKVTDDLILEVWKGGKGDRPLVKLRSLAEEADGEAVGAVVIWPQEIRHLVDALVEAAGLLAEEAAR